MKRTTTAIQQSSSEALFAGSAPVLPLGGPPSDEFERVQVYRFGEFELDERCLELRDPDHCVSVQPRVMELLVYLIRNRERLVTRQELLDRLWGVVAVVDNALTTAICEARKAVGDNHTLQWAIKTIPRRGYRFVALVDAVSVSACRSEYAVAHATKPRTSGRPSPPWSGPWR